MPLNRQVDRHLKQLDQHKEDHRKEYEVRGRLDAQQLGCPYRDAGENADHQQHRENDPIDRIVDLKLCLADQVRHGCLTLLFFLLLPTYQLQALALFFQEWLASESAYKFGCSYEKQ